MNYDREEDEEAIGEIVISEQDNNDDDEEEEVVAASWSELLALAKPEWRWIFLGCFALLLRLPFSLASPHFQSECIGAAINGDRSKLRTNVLLLIGSGVVNSLLDFWNVFLFDFGKARLLRRLRINLFKTILDQEAAFFDANSSGWLMSRLAADTGEMGNDLTWLFRWSIESICRIAGITIYLFLRDVRLALIVICVVPPVTLINFFYGKWLRINAARVQASLAKAGATANEALISSRTVICCAAENFEVYRYAKRIQDYYNLSVQQAMAQAAYYMACYSFLVGTTVPAAILWIGGLFLIQDQISPSVLIAFMLYQAQLLEYTSNLLNSITSLLKSSGSGGEVFEILKRQNKTKIAHSRNSNNTETSTMAKSEVRNPLDQPLLDPEDSRIQSSTLQGRIEFKYVSFTYPRREQPALHDISFTLEARSSLYIVGPSGAGKSSCFHLLFALYEPDSGLILLDGQSVSTFETRTLRSRALALVSQEPCLFDGTILQNILYGRNDLDRAHATQAAKTACAHHFISDFPRGYDTQVGEGGALLSGGQKQRIAIARAVAREPTVLLLDEATSALDQESDKLVRAALKSAAEGRTTISITHRVNTARDPNDHILVLSKGRLIQYGTHAELSQQVHGLYASLLKSDSLHHDRLLL